jgi:hypothetical protein
MCEPPVRALVVRRIIAAATLAPTVDHLRALLGKCRYSGDESEICAR